MTVIRREGIEREWKSRISAALKMCGLVPEKFTGQVRISMCDGGISCLTKEETLR